MENSQLYLNKIMLNIASSKEQGLNFVKGEVLRGVVQDIKADGLVSLFIKGQMIDALSEVLVQPGQQLQLMVEDFKEGRAYLKVLTPQLMERIENSNISLNLSEIGVPAKEENIMMARNLLHYKLPVTPNNLNMISKALVILGGINEKNAEIAAFSISRKLPLDAPALKSLAQFLTSANDISKLTVNLEKGLLQLEQAANRPALTSGSAPTESLRQIEEMQRGAARQPGISEKAFITAAGKGNEPFLQAAGKNPEIPAMTIPKNASPPPAMEGRLFLEQPGSGTGGKTINSAGQDPGKVKLEALLSGTINNKEQAVDLASRRNIPAATGKAPDAKWAAALASSRTMLAEENIKAPILVNPEKAGGDMLELTKTLSGRVAAAWNNPASGAENTSASPGNAGLQEEATAVKPAFSAGPPAADGKTTDVSGIPPGNTPDKAPAAGALTAENTKQVSGQGPIVQASPPAASESISEALKGGPALASTPDKDWPAPEQRELLRHLPLLRTILETLNLSLEGNSREIGDRMQNAVVQERELIRALALLQDIIKNDPNAAKNPLMADLFNRIEGMEKELSAQRMLNFFSRGVADSNINYLYFAFPVKWGDKYQLGQLKINRELGKRDLIKQDNIRFIVSLDTAQIGAVLFHVNWKKSGELEVQGVVEQAEIREYLNSNLEELFRGLRGLGYQVKNLGIKVLEREEEMMLRLALEETTLNLRPFGIDIRV